MNTRIDCVLDEMSWNVAAALSGANQVGLRYGVVRMCGETRFPEVSESDWTLLDSAVESGRLVVKNVSPGLYKEDFTATDLNARIARDVAQTSIGARRLRASAVSLFSWKKSPGAAAPPIGEPSPAMPGELPKYIRLLADGLHAEGMTPLLENCYWQWGDSGAATAELIRRSGSANLRLLWDPANSIAARWDWHREVGAGEFAATELLLGELRDASSLVGGVHVRDIALDANGWKWVPLGDGVIDWNRILRALDEIGYEGPLTIEHHLPNKIEATRHAFNFLSTHAMQLQ